jgi:HSP20 family molecular chaperone IbpA
VCEDAEPDKDTRYRLHERLEQRFERTFALPQEVDGERITAAFEKVC